MALISLSSSATRDEREDALAVLLEVGDFGGEDDAFEKEL